MLLLLPMVFLLFGFSYNNHHSEITEQIEDSLYVPLDTTRFLTNTPYITFMVENFVEDATRCGVDSSEVVEHIHRLDIIFLGEFIDDEMWGYNLMMEDSLVTIGIRGSIFINENTMSDPKLFRLTIYHELGHWFGLDHCGCDDEIMQDYKYDDKLIYIYEHWDVLVIKMMYDIKEQFNEETSTFDYPDSLFVN
ncbi:MAG: putative hydrolase [uncultured marine phage]|uniref:Putative hydrolase n=1 Tax=uncultured marine phage TaxID=707152 RepID=A0A8D9CFC7_9VIRU|nr:MAG: putative hydrolase [uncultured marine phage]